LSSHYISFEAAKVFVRSLKLNSKEDWELYINGKLPLLPSKPLEIPLNPQQIYVKQGWRGWKYFLGVRYINKDQAKYLPFDQARIITKRLCIRNVEDWIKYCRGKIDIGAPRPDFIPVNPKRIYSWREPVEWKGWNDWLGVEENFPTKITRTSNAVKMFR